MAERLTLTQRYLLASADRPHVPLSHCETAALIMII